jgi:hypothetical protein
VNNPKVAAAICGIAVLLIGFRMLTATEAPGTAVNLMNWMFLLLALVGLVGSLVILSRRPRR